MDLRGGKWQERLRLLNIPAYFALKLPKGQAVALRKCVSELDTKDAGPETAMCVKHKVVSSICKNHHLTVQTWLQEKEKKKRKKKKNSAYYGPDYS